MSFADLGLSPELLRALADKGYDAPTPIQAQAIPFILAGKDVLAGAQTGTGKTAAFVLPILQKLGARTANRSPRALVLTPTRELAAQVAESARTYGAHTNLRTVVAFGGVGIHPQIDALRNGCDVLVGTPGRLLDLAEQRVLDLRSVEYFVLDEADRMLDMGFIHAIKQVLKLLPQVRQNLMFSATYSEEIRELAGRFLRNPAGVEVASRNATADKVDQTVYKVSKEHKRYLLAHLINEHNWHQVLVFTRTKHGANRLADQLQAFGIPTSAIHGNKSQGARVRALNDFKALKVVALVATEVAARGLDIKELPHVVNYELPNVPEDYVHRIGRTARAGSTGSAVSLVSPDEHSQLRGIERLLRRSLTVAPLPQFSTIAPDSARAANAAAPPADSGEGERRDSRGPHRGGGQRRSAGGGGGGRGRGGHHGGGQGHGPRRDGGASQPRAAGEGQHRSNGASRPNGEGQQRSAQGQGRPSGGGQRPAGQGPHRDAPRGNGGPRRGGSGSGGRGRSHGSGGHSQGGARDSGFRSGKIA